MFGDIISFLTMPVLGAIIAFSTNVLAIVMLFRPHNPLRIGGVVLPFTPGLIPKEKAVLAKNIGDVLGNSLLTPQALVEAVSNTGVIDAVSDKAGKMFNDLLDDSRSLGYLLSNGIGISEEELSIQINARVHTIMDYVFETVAPDFIEKAGRGKKISHIVPPALTQYLKDTARRHIPQSADFCRKILEHPTGEQLLRKTVTKIVKDNAKGLLGIFINPDKIYDNITEGLLEFLESQAGQDIMAQNLNKAVDWLMEQNFDQMPETARIWLIEAVAKFSTQLKEAGHAHKLTETILAMSPAQLLPESNRDKDVTTIVRPVVAFLAEKAGKYLVGILNIPQMVEEKINQLDMREMEKLLLSVVGKQLKWIAVLGGVLGFIIGLLPTVLNGF